MKSILLLSIFLCGCAALHGQTAYELVGDQPFVAERVGSFPQMPKSFIKPMPNYWLMPVNKIATVSNPLDTTVKVKLLCEHSFPESFELVIPQHTSQYVLLTTNATHMYETLCQIRDYSILGEK